MEWQYGTSFDPASIPSNSALNLIVNSSAPDHSNKPQQQTTATKTEQLSISRNEFCLCDGSFEVGAAAGTSAKSFV